MRRYHLLHDHWAATYPPLYVSMGLMAGVKASGADARPLTADFNPHADAHPNSEALVHVMPGGVMISPEGFQFGPPLVATPGGTDG